MKTFLIITLQIFCLQIVYAQKNLKNYFPKQIQKIDLSATTANEIIRQNELLEKEKRTQKEQIALDTLLHKYGEVTTSVWDIIGAECSWYCGGGNYYIKASSKLHPAKGIVYNEKNANDLNYKTAWIEGKADEGIGEFLEYYFKNQSPRVTKIIICNGYMKSDLAWKNNNRVKKLKLYANGKPIGILNLEDSKTTQIFDVGTFGHNANKTDLILKFEILEVYKGDTFNDTAITEIYFDGIDVH